MTILISIIIFVILLLVSIFITLIVITNKLINKATNVTTPIITTPIITTPVTTTPVTTTPVSSSSILSIFLGVFGGLCLIILFVLFMVNYKKKSLIQKTIPLQTPQKKKISPIKWVESEDYSALPTPETNPIYEKLQRLRK